MAVENKPWNNGKKRNSGGNDNFKKVKKPRIGKLDCWNCGN